MTVIDPPTGFEEDASSGHEWRLGRFPSLMRKRVENILLVSTAYDAFTLEEDGLLTELIYSEYVDLGLTHAPRVTRVATGEAALRTLREERFDLVISMLRLGDMDVRQFAAEARQAAADVQIVLLIVNELELARLGDRHDLHGVDSIYVWHGDPKLFLAIIKTIEDRWNADFDTQVGSVGVIILVEDSVRYRSSLLPMLYSEIVDQTRAVMLDGINRMHRQMRLRARPKILVAENYEDAFALYQRYKDYIFGIITDVRYLRRGVHDPNAGIDFIHAVRADNPDVPALLESSDPENRRKADALGCSFLHKRSHTLLRDMHTFIVDNFGFGDFVFKQPDSGQVVGRAANLQQMIDVLPNVPDESLLYHAGRNHFSNWLRARTEFSLAARLRPVGVSQFKDAEALRSFLITSFEDAIRMSRLGLVEDFSRERYGPTTIFARIGGGSLGGKARGLAFMDALLLRDQLHRRFDNVRIFVPRSVVIGTDVFDECLELNGITPPTMEHTADETIQAEFDRAVLPPAIVEDLRAYLDKTRCPIAVRSSSLLEDSQYYPFAGVYETYMIPNNHEDDQVRLRQLCDAIKRVYVSTFSTVARKYVQATPHRIEEQKMAVILQEVVGQRHEHYFYPSFAGVVRSHNYYPFGHMKPEDGVAMVGIGLGQFVVQGGECLRFCPAHPQVLPQLSAGKRFIDQSQRFVYAIDLARDDWRPEDHAHPIIRKLNLREIEAHGTLAPVGSVWSPDDQSFYDGIYRPGVRVVTFAHVLKSGLFPLADILMRVIALAREGMGGPVEIEFAGSLDASPREFALLQIRPYGIGSDAQAVSVDGLEPRDMICYCTQALGNGVLTDLTDLVYVRPDRFEAAKTPEIAQAISRLNEKLQREQRSYVLIGPGRWGSSNSWLGIPVAWSQISEARVIVEAALEHFRVDPSQGSHFFHNLTSSGAAYLTINPSSDGSFVDWQWLAAQPAAEESYYVRHLRLPAPLEVRIDGRNSRAAVLKRSALREE